MPDKGGRMKALVERLFQDALGAIELYTVFLGERLGLYQGLAEGDPATSSELAQRTSTGKRYVREWFEHDANSGLLEVDDARADRDGLLSLLPPARLKPASSPTAPGGRV
jgi:hypothetical protein